jgi:hypothetical protein
MVLALDQISPCFWSERALFILCSYWLKLGCISRAPSLTVNWPVFVCFLDYSSLYPYITHEHVSPTPPVKMEAACFSEMLLHARLHIATSQKMTVWTQTTVEISQLHAHETVN